MPVGTAFSAASASSGLANSRAVSSTLVVAVVRQAVPSTIPVLPVWIWEVQDRHLGIREVIRLRYSVCNALIAVAGKAPPPTPLHRNGEGETGSLLPSPPRWRGAGGRSRAP